MADIIRIIIKGESGYGPVDRCHIRGKRHEDRAKPPSHCVLDRTGISGIACDRVNATVDLPVDPVGVQPVRRVGYGRDHMDGHGPKKLGSV